MHYYYYNNLNINSSKRLVLSHLEFRLHTYQLQIQNNFKLYSFVFINTNLNYFNF